MSDTPLSSKAVALEAIKRHHVRLNIVNMANRLVNAGEVQRAALDSLVENINHLLDANCLDIRVEVKEHQHENA